MIKVKDGYAKLIGTTYSGSVSRVLLSNGGDHILGNSNGNIPLNNGTVNTNLNADKLDGIHANGLLTALSNSNNGISITVGGTTKSISNISVNYASSAGSATKVIVNLHTTNDINYPLVWSNLANTNTVTENQLYKSWSDLYYNPKNKRLTVGGSVVASSFVKSGGTSLQLLRADGGIATFNWSGQSGLPTWLWGGNNLHSYYVYNPSNFRVAYASSAGNADTVDGYHASSGNNKPWGTIPVITTLGFMDIGKDLEFHYDNSTGSDYSTVLMCTGNYSNIVNLPSATGTLALTSDNVASSTNAYHLYINSANTWSTWYWAGLSGLPSWLWGSNDGTNMYVWDPNNFNVHTALYLRSLGNLNCQTGRTLNYGDVYSYNTMYGNTGAPTDYTSVIGFGRGIGGTVEIAGGWCNTGLYWRSLRDCCEDWYSWRTVLDSSNYTGYVDNYYWANVKISTSSSTTTSPTVHTLTATRVCAGHNPGIDNSISCSNWFRSSGATGWYNTTYSGGWYMSDTSWIRAHNNVGIYTGGQIYSSSSIRMGHIYLLNTNEINSASGLHLNYQSSGNVSLCEGGGKVGIGTTAPSYKLDVNGNIWCRGALNVGSTLSITDSVINCSSSNISIKSKESGSLMIGSLEVIRYGSNYTSFYNKVSFSLGLSLQTDTPSFTSSTYTTDNVTVLIGTLMNNSDFLFRPANDGLLLFLKVGRAYSNVYLRCTAKDCEVVKANGFDVHLARNVTKNYFGDGLSRIFIYKLLDERWYEFYCG